MPVFLWERAWPAGLQVAVPAGKCLLPCPGPNRSRKTGRRLPGIRAAILAVCCPEGALPPQTACAVGEPAVAQVPGSMRGHPGTAVSGCWRYPAACPSRRHLVEMSPGSAQVRSYGNRAFVGAAAARHDMLRCARGGGGSGACCPARRRGHFPLDRPAVPRAGTLPGGSPVGEAAGLSLEVRSLPAGEQLRHCLQKVLGLAHHAHPRPAVAGGGMVFHLPGSREKNSAAAMLPAGAGVDDEPREVRVVNQYFEQLLP